MTSLQLKDDICKVLSDKKAKDIVSIDISDSTVMCDYFVVCSAKNTVQVKALCEHVAHAVEEKYGILPKSREGYQEGRWIILDYYDVVVHIFYDETRLFYHIERLWSSGNNVAPFEPAEKTAPAKKPKQKPNKE